MSPPILVLKSSAWLDTGHEGRELQEVAAVQGKLADLLPRDQAGYLAPMVWTATAGPHRDVLRKGAGLEPHVDGTVVGHVRATPLTTDVLNR